ncbi:gamma-glutamyltransferase [Oscillatoria sp. CS-180]|uniref:gamma-glutamyltransferase n=1 Tax=Oscillatoria sp. CS-180 TaxID=3021720 RepID=UPI00232CAF02|nr:gamma-glutamyltransferase [Oscillatoria sp. CS-180]MDB9526351.1 gamma-glutamyltransferase [Oscillatoria sp. CS-180]
MNPTEEPVTSKQGMVICPHSLASEVGAQILRDGGNAVDAAIAIQAALGVVYPHMTGLGGDAFWLIYDAKSQALYGLNGSGRAAQRATIDLYQQQGHQFIPQRGPLAAMTVPGAVASWEQAHRRFGQQDWTTLLQPAIALAELGYPVSGSQSYWTRRDRPHFEQHSPSACPFLAQGEVPAPQSILKNPDLARTLETLSHEGASAFYQGAIAQQIADHLNSVGGLLTLDDFTAHHSDWVKPIETTYQGYRIAQLPPNSQGFAVLQMLNLIEPFDLQGMGHDSADYYHLMIEATKLALVDRGHWLTDPDFVKIPINKLVSKAYADRRRFQLSLTRAGQYAAVPMGSDTTYTAVADAFGNAVSVIQSIYFDFGSAVVVPQTGFVLQNRGCFFSLNPNHLNCLMPGKRTFHTLMPGMVLQPSGHPYLILGTMGGEGQPQTQLALLTRLLDFGFDPQTAIDEPRWLWGRTWGDETVSLTLEGRIPIAVRQALRERGHVLTVGPDWNVKMGHAHVIRYAPDTETMEGGCDRRSDGIAIGL